MHSRPIALLFRWVVPEVYAGRIEKMNLIFILKKVDYEKTVIIFLVALFTLSLTSCSYDDDIYYFTEGDVNGVYLGAIDVEAPFGGVDM